MKEVQTSITPTALPTVIAEKSDFQTTENTGKFVINPQFDKAFFYGFHFAQGSFSEGLAAVRIGDEESGKWGFIDKQGKMVINPQFGNFSDFREGLAAVRIGDEESGKWGFIDKQGKMVINPQFHTAALFSEGLAAVAKNRDPFSWGYVDKQGKMAINHQYDHVSSFSDGLAAVLIGDSTSGKWGYISR